MRVRPLSALEIVQLWEWGQDKHPIDRALVMLTLGQPELDLTQAAALSIGQRNTRLLTLREQTLGATLNGYAKCPQCAEQLEFAFQVTDIRLPEPEQQLYSVQVDTFELHFRLPNSHDLAAIIGFGDMQAARRLLVERCLYQAVQNGAVSDVGQLPDSVIPALAEAVIKHDPQAEMRFGLECPTCHHEWSMLFDIGAFFWTELGDRVTRLFYDVHALARAYSWREADILAMSTRRRRFYLDLISPKETGF